MKVLLIEDNINREVRRKIPGISSSSRKSALIRLHRLVNNQFEVLAEKVYRTGNLKRIAPKGGKASIALELIDGFQPHTTNTVIVAGPVYGCNKIFLEGVLDRNLDLAVEIRPSTNVRALDLKPRNSNKEPLLIEASELLQNAEWKSTWLPVPGKNGRIKYHVASLGSVALSSWRRGHLFAAQTGGIPGVHPGTVLAVTSLLGLTLRQLLKIVGWTRWIRPLVRKQERDLQDADNASCQSCRETSQSTAFLNIRTNISIAKQQDQSSVWKDASSCLPKPSFRGRVAGSTTFLNVAELFAGAGGMGLGFLLAGRGKKRYRLVHSAEVHPIYVETLKQNHKRFVRRRRAPNTDYIPDKTEPVDLTEKRSLAKVESIIREAGGVDVLVGGPPCQGFSNANRNSWHPNNPHNQMVGIFLKYVKRLQPSIFLMENVQGIAWTLKKGKSRSKPTVAKDFLRRAETAGYLVFPKMLDAVWYGVPQYRTRFFVLGIHRDLGYEIEDFGEWGPFPHPTHGPGAPLAYTTVRDAIGDLPPVPNGHRLQETPYIEPSSKIFKRKPYLRTMRIRAPKNVILDHVTSRHADYVIKRYHQIPPGGNWRDIVNMLTNYSEVSRTHSNIYRRLNWDEPSITIGHYRKSMIVHPQQHRGLSLREASRLQSFPDWFHFAGATDSGNGGLNHKQQQLANAVCPLVTKALAEFILNL